MGVLESIFLHILVIYVCSEAVSILGSASPDRVEPVITTTCAYSREAKDVACRGDLPRYSYYYLDALHRICAGKRGGTKRGFCKK